MFGQIKSSPLVPSVLVNRPRAMLGKKLLSAQNASFRFHPE